MRIQPLASSTPVQKPDATAVRACQDFEAMFIKQMLSEMHRSGGNMMGKGPAGDIYQDLCDEELSHGLSRAGGIGIAQMLLRQLSPEKGSTEK
ncbi:MAG TPA: rod-binding protein [Armatimonadota bacterium]|nr:rod-binding protein [Armatimonadota bacterium]